RGDERGWDGDFDTRTASESSDLQAERGLRHHGGGDGTDRAGPPRRLRPAVRARPAEVGVPREGQGGGREREDAVPREGRRSAGESGVRAGGEVPAGEAAPILPGGRPPAVVRSCRFHGFTGTDDPAAAARWRAD